MTGDKDKERCEYLAKVRAAIRESKLKPSPIVEILTGTYEP